ncbi:hypothetical protein a10_09408 [Streptomyces acidiscabies]|nr:hypothetical protein a10_09408 [Streptomyces acidiscabies]
MLRRLPTPPPRTRLPVPTDPHRTPTNPRPLSHTCAAEASHPTRHHHRPTPRFPQPAQRVRQRPTAAPSSTAPPRASPSLRSCGQPHPTCPHLRLRSRGQPRRPAPPQTRTPLPSARAARPTAPHSRTQQRSTPTHPHVPHSARAAEASRAAPHLPALAFLRLRSRVQPRCGAHRPALVFLRLRSAEVSRAARRHHKPAPRAAPPPARTCPTQPAQLWAAVCRTTCRPVPAPPLP